MITWPLDKVEYYVDDELKQTFDADEVSANGGSLELSVDSSNTFRNVSVKAYDKANNEATTASVDVLVSANTWVQFYQQLNRHSTVRLEAVWQQWQLQ